MPSFTFVTTLVLVIANLSNAFNLPTPTFSKQFELGKQTEESDKNLLIAQSGNRKEFFSLLVSSISFLPVIAIASEPSEDAPKSDIPAKKEDPKPKKVAMPEAATVTAKTPEWLKGNTKSKMEAVEIGNSNGLPKVLFQ